MLCFIDNFIEFYKKTVKVFGNRMIDKYLDIQFLPKKHLQ